MVQQENGREVRVSSLEKFVEKLDEKVDSIIASLGEIKLQLATMPQNYVTMQEHDKLIKLVDCKASAVEVEKMKEEVRGKANKEDLKRVYVIAGIAGSVVGFIVATVEHVVNIWQSVVH